MKWASKSRKPDIQFLYCVINHWSTYVSSATQDLLGSQVCTLQRFHPLKQENSAVQLSHPSWRARTWDFYGTHFSSSASVSWRKTNEQTNNQWTVKSLKILGKQTLLESNFQIFILQCNNTKHLTINFKVTLLHYLSIRKRQKAFQTSTKQVFHLFTFTTTFSKDNWENIQINNIWKILFPSGREAERRIFGSIYIPETPGVNPKEEKEVEFCSEVLILASTFQASVGEVQGRKNNKLHIAGNVEEVSYLMMNRVK